jgi:hypothetical protein
VRSILCLAAEGVVRDAVTDVISIYNIMEQVTGEGFPLLIQKMVFLAVWQREPTEATLWTGDLRIRLDEKELFSHKTSLDFKDKLRNRSIITLGGLVLPGPGKLTFAYQLDTDTRVTYEVDVIAAGPKATNS